MQTKEERTTGFQPIIPPSGDVLARDVTWEAFLAQRDWEHAEWVDGWVVKMPGIELTHDSLSAFLRRLLEFFLDLSGRGGRVFQEPVLVRVGDSRSGRSPDLMIVLPENPAVYHENYIRGVPDLIVEIVSPKGERRDRVEKFREYESAGVPEYWILDYKFRESAFYQLNERGEYERIAPDENGIYTSRVLPKLTLPAALLWGDSHPTPLETVRLVEGMLTDEEAG